MQQANFQRLSRAMGAVRSGKTDYGLCLLFHLLLHTEKSSLSALKVCNKPVMLNQEHED